MTIRNGGVPGSGWVADEIYLFYNTDGHVLEYEEIDKNIDDDEVAVRAENGFSSLGPGETITRQVEIWLRWWSGLKVGGRYKLLMPRGYIGWWDYGAMEVRYYDCGYWETWCASLFTDGLSFRSAIRIARSDRRMNGKMGFCSCRGRIPLLLKLLRDCS